jgi:hypothetical protein
MRTRSVRRSKADQSGQGGEAVAANEEEEGEGHLLRKSHAKRPGLKHCKTLFNSKGRKVAQLSSERESERNFEGRSAKPTVCVSNHINREQMVKHRLTSLLWCNQDICE